MEGVERRRISLTQTQTVGHCFASHLPMPAGTEVRPSRILRFDFRAVCRRRVAEYPFRLCRWPCRWRRSRSTGRTAGRLRAQNLPADLWTYFAGAKAVDKQVDKAVDKSVGKAGDTSQLAGSSVLVRR